MGKNKGKNSNNKLQKNIIKTILGLMILVGIALWNKYNDEPETPEQPTEPKVLNAPTENDSTDLLNKKIGKSEFSLSQLKYEKEARPVMKANRKDEVVEHKAYSLSYNKDYKVANWVFYELTQEEIKGSLQRSDNFQADPKLKRADASQLEDYRHSGWDRGHMAPSMDMNWDETILDESYFLSNMCPQGHDFNSGIWLDLEHEVRFWAKRDSAVCVVCGPILPKQGDKNYNRLPHSQVLIPEAFYKIVFAPFAKNGPRAIAFIMPNRQEDRKVSSYAVTIDSVETITGIDFFPVLPDDLEEAVESTYNLRDWFRKKDI